MLRRAIESALLLLLMIVGTVLIGTFGVAIMASVTR